MSQKKRKTRRGVKKAWRSFPEAREYARGLGIKGSGGWKTWWKEHDRPADIPSWPPQAYAEAWNGWKDFLGDSYVEPTNKKGGGKARRSFPDPRPLVVPVCIRVG